MLDQNKTPETHRATASAAGWMASIGCKPVESEVRVADGWVADLAGFWEPTMTEAKRTKLLKQLCPDDVVKDSTRAFAWLAKRYGYRFSVIVEVKVTRSDFKKDDGRKYSTTRTRPDKLSPANMLIVAAPKSAVGKDGVGLLPDAAWLELSADCDRVIKLHGWGYPHATHPHQDADIAFGMIEALDHRTRNARFRELNKAYRSRQNEIKAASIETRVAGYIDSVLRAVDRGQPAPDPYGFGKKLYSQLERLTAMLGANK